jgi:hypothetical protein
MEKKTIRVPLIVIGVLLSAVIVLNTSTLWSAAVPAVTPTIGVRYASSTAVPANTSNGVPGSQGIGPSSSTFAGAPTLRSAAIPAATPTIGAHSASPTTVPASIPTKVTVTAVITDPSLIPGSVNLIQLSQGTATILGQLHDDGLNGDAVAGDHIFTIVQTFNSPVGQIQLEVSAAFKGMLRRVLSPSFPVLFLNTPPAFTLNSGPLLVGGPLAFNNFASIYAQGGVIPPNGAEIDVTSVPLPSPPISNFIALELIGSSVASTSALTVSGISCSQVFYIDTFTASITYKNEAVYCPSGTTLYKFYLSYRAGDSNESQYLSSFQQLLSGAKFAP